MLIHKPSDILPSEITPRSLFERRREFLTRSGAGLIAGATLWHGLPKPARAAIAGHLNTTPETISRVLVKLQDAGAIRFDRHRILITDRDLLRSIAEL